MKPFIYSCLITLFSIHVFSQQSKIDSLTVLVAKDPTHIALTPLGIILIKDGHVEKANEIFEKCIIKCIDDDRKLGLVYNSIGNVYLGTGSTYEAEDYFLKALEKTLTNSDTALISAALNGLSICYVGSNEEKSIEVNQKILSMNNSNNQDGLIAYINISDAFITLGKPYEAIAEVNKGLKLLNHNESLQAILQHNFGKAFVLLNQPDSAYKHIKMTISLNIQSGDTVGLIYDYHLLGNYFRLVSKKRDAANAFNKSISLYANYGYVDNGWDNGEYLECLEDLAKTYSEMGLKDSAIYLLNLSRDRTNEIRNSENKKRSEKNYALYESNIRNQLKLKGENRKFQIQYYAIAAGLVIISLVYLSFSRFDKQRKYSKYISIFILLLIFEFVLVWLDPYIYMVSGDIPLYKFMLNIVAAVVVIPVHRGGEKLLNRVVLEVKFKNVGE